MLLHALYPLRARFAVVALLIAAATVAAPARLALAEPAVGNVTVSAESTKLDDESLKRMLQGMGYEPDEKPWFKGTRAFVISEKIKGWTFVLQFSLSKDKKHIWVFSHLGIVPNDCTIPADVLVELLDHNFNSTHMKFSYSKQKRQFRLEGMTLNEDVRPSVLRSMIKETLETLPKTSKLWWPEYWPEDAADIPQELNETKDEA